MRVAVQGCSHGSLDEIYRTIEAYTAATSNVVDLLLLCGDFQAVRSKHDFASLAMPPKYFALGSFNEYYSGKRVAPCLTLVVGGNHEASNYMWELFYGGWLAPNIYYLGAAGCVQVDGLRIVGLSGIYKDHDYNKGHFETMPLDRSTMRSIYHIRRYEVMKTMHLPIASPTITLSHDWPAKIYHHGDTNHLLRKKPFFEKEVKDDSLGAPPLMEVLEYLKPEYWFSAHLHVKFAAVYDHRDGHVPIPLSSLPHNAKPEAAANPDEIQIEDDEDEPKASAQSAVVENNPDEINIDDDEDEEEEKIVYKPTEAAPNPDEINLDDEDDDGEEVSKAGADGPSTVEEARAALKVDESVDLIETVRQADTPLDAGPSTSPAEAIPTPTSVPINGKTENTAPKGEASGRQTKFLALDKVLPGRDFIQFLDIPTPQATINHRPRMTFDPNWLAITRAMHPYLSLSHRQMEPPFVGLPDLIQKELDQIQSQGLLVPELPREGEESPVPTLVWEKGPIDVDRVQKFWPTAPAHGEPGGSDTAWYTNPQTEAFCGMLGIQNKINPSPEQPRV